MNGTWWFIVACFVLAACFFAAEFVKRRSPASIAGFVTMLLMLANTILMRLAPESPLRSPLMLLALLGLGVQIWLMRRSHA